jgi:hypothetical protein
MSDPEQFRAWLAEVSAAAPRAGEVPLIGYDELDLQDAQAAALISVLADIIEASCVVSSAMPHVAAA